MTPSVARNLESGENATPYIDCCPVTSLRIGVDSEGHKHVLGLREGASENAVVVKDLLNDLVDRGLERQRRRLSVIDGSRALRKGIDEVFGPKNPVPRCRNHKIRNVLSYLPQDRQGDVRSAMKAAFCLRAKEGIAKLKKPAQRLEHEYPSAAGSLLEGLEEIFTINRLDLPDALRRCLGATNVIEPRYSGVRFTTRRVKNWRDASMVLRWVSSSLLSAEKQFRRGMGCQQLWILETKLQEIDQDESVATESKVA